MLFEGEGKLIAPVHRSRFNRRGHTRHRQPRRWTQADITKFHSGPRCEFFADERYFPKWATTTLNHIGIPCSGWSLTFISCWRTVKEPPGKSILDPCSITLVVWETANHTSFIELLKTKRFRSLLRSNVLFRVHCRFSVYPLVFTAVKAFQRLAGGFVIWSEAETTALSCCPQKVRVLLDPVGLSQCRLKSPQWTTAVDSFPRVERAPPRFRPGLFYPMALRSAVGGMNLLKQSHSVRGFPPGTSVPRQELTNLEIECILRPRRTQSSATGTPPIVSMKISSHFCSTRVELAAYVEDPTSESGCKSVPFFEIHDRGVVDRRRLIRVRLSCVARDRFTCPAYRGSS